LILNELMKVIARKEQEHEEPHNSSFAPWSDGPSMSESSSQAPSAYRQTPKRAQTEPCPTATFLEKTNGFTVSPPSKLKTFTLWRMPTMRRNSSQPVEVESHSELRTNRYLPCHYFDFVVGTSTGGLVLVYLYMYDKILT